MHKNYLIALPVIAFMASPSYSATLIAHWTLDTPSQFADSSGNSQTLSQNGTNLFSTTTPSPAGGSYYESGGSTNNLSATVAAMPSGNAERTISLWLNPTTQGDRKFIGLGSGAGTTFDFTVEGNGIRVRHGAGNVTFGNTITNAGGWYHIAIRVPAGASTHADLGVFINGAAASISNDAGSSTTLNSAADTSIFLGNNNSAATAYDGFMDDIQIYSDALTDSDISGLFNNPGSVAVPEPSAVALLGLGALAMLKRRRK